MDMESLQVQLLGEVSFTRADGTRERLRGTQPRAVFALLVTERHRTVSRQEIADLLWDGRLPDHWAGAVRGVITKIRAFLAGATRIQVDLTDGSEIGVRPVDLLVTSHDGWHLVLPTDSQVDVEMAVAALALAEDLVGSDALEALRLAEQADMLLRGEFAPGASGEWIELHRAECERRRRRALQLRGDAGLGTGRHASVIGAGHDLVALDPFDEHARRLLMEGFDLSGDRRAALGVHQDLRRLLADEFGGLPEPATEQLASRIRDHAPSRVVSTTPPIPSTGTGQLFGRDEECRVLERVWNQVVTSRSLSLVVIEAEPGAGKTRLAAEFDQIVAPAGRLLWGRCSADQGVAYEPVVEALGRVLHAEPSLLEPLGPLALELRPLLPEVVPVEDVDDDAAAVQDATAARSQLFRAVAALARSTIDRPTAWVIDDLQWAGDDTAALLTHLMGALADQPVLIIATTRNLPPTVSTLLAHAGRLGNIQTMELTGLGARGVTEMLRAGGVQAAEAIGPTVHERTGGNPFFVEQMLALTDDSGHLDAVAIPDTLRTWFAHRVASLDRDLAAVLSIASVIGMEVDVGLLSACSSLGEWELLDRCDELIAEGFLVESGRPARLAFPHALTRDSVYDAIGATRRAWLHRRVGQALREQVERGDQSARIASLAFHFSLAGPEAHDEAIGALLAAGNDALEQAAWETAATWFRGVSFREPAASVARVDALIGTGRALRGSGDRAGARAAFSEALDSARLLDQPRWVARATLGLVGGGARGVSDDVADSERASLLTEALDGLSPKDDDLAIPLQTELALALLLTDQVDERERMSLHALERARRHGDPALLGQALLGSRLARLDAVHAEQRLREIDEVLAIPTTHRSHELTLGALMAQHEDALLVGDRDLARGALARAEELIAGYDHPYWKWVVASWRTLDLVIDGELERAEAQAFETMTLQPDHPEAIACLGVNLVDIRLFQGRSDEMIDLLRDAADDNPQIPGYRAVLALCLAESERIDDCRIEYETFALPSFTNVPFDTNRLLTLAVLADVAATLADPVGAAELTSLLEPHGSRQVVLNCFAGGGAYWGPVATQLGRLHGLLGNDEQSELWTARAQDAALRFGAPLAAARVPV